jgi:hypothetical protein
MMKYYQATITVNIQAETQEQADEFVEKVKASVPPEETNDDTPGIYEYFATQAYEDE